MYTARTSLNKLEKERRGEGGEGEGGEWEGTKTMLTIIVINASHQHIINTTAIEGLTVSVIEGEAKFDIECEVIVLTDRGLSILDLSQISYGIF